MSFRSPLLIQMEEERGRGQRGRGGGELAFVEKTDVPGKVLMCIYSLNPYNNPLGRYDDHSHFTDGKTEAQKGKEITQDHS